MATKVPFERFKAALQRYVFEQIVPKVGDFKSVIKTKRTGYCSCAFLFLRLTKQTMLAIVKAMSAMGTTGTIITLMLPSRAEMPIKNASVYEKIF